MLADLFVAKDYEAGELVFDEGVVGDSMYVIESGSVEVLRKNPQGEYQQPRLRCLAIRSSLVRCR